MPRSSNICLYTYVDTDIDLDIDSDIALDMEKMHKFLDTSTGNMFVCIVYRAVVVQHVFSIRQMPFRIIQSPYCGELGCLERGPWPFGVRVWLTSMELYA